jgi:adenine-specific DNA-methyltransferase
MKYMGNKTKMLPLLGEILRHHSKDAGKIADPFCGSASVAWYLAQHTDKEIIAGDIQSFAVARARAVVERTEVIDPTELIKNWFSRADKLVANIASHFPNHLKSIEPDLTAPSAIKAVVSQSRKFCKDVLPTVFQNFGGVWPISKAYGGYYFSPVQALVFDALRKTLPRENAKKAIAVAALVEAASRAAASPGHTAQPFQPTISSARYIIEAWSRDVWILTETAVNNIASRYARASGAAVLGDFTQSIESLDAGDLVFADPPYSGVHYSRFYHVLETVSRGAEFTPEGRGRYPSITDRPSSAFSKKTASLKAARALVETCAEKGLTLVLTFPSAASSNGLKAGDFVDAGMGLFSTIDVHEVQTDFSTLGGNKVHRAARKAYGESIISFVP